MTKPRVNVGPGSRFSFSPEYLAANGGAIAGVPQKAPKGAKAAKKIATARIQSAVYGFVIPMLSIPKLYKALESAVAEGKSDADLKAIVAAFPGVTS